MKTFRYAMFVGAALMASATVSQAQGRMGGTMTPTTRASSRSVPNGMCQVWINGLPANRQPAPTDCETARRRATGNSRIIYGAGTTRGNVGYPNGQYGGQAYPGERGRGNREAKAQHEREKFERKQQKEREKAWRKAHKKGERYDDRDDDRRDRRDGATVNGPILGTNIPRTTTTTTTTTRSCADANRDGICDIMQTARGSTRPK